MYNKIDGYLIKIKGERGNFGTFRKGLFLAYILPSFTKKSITTLLYVIATEKDGTVDRESIVIVKEANIVRFDYIIAGAVFQRFSVLVTLIPLTTFKYELS